MIGFPPMRIFIWSDPIGGLTPASDYVFNQGSPLSCDSRAARTPAHPEAIEFLVHGVHCGYANLKIKAEV